MGNPKLKWTAEEEEALLAGVAKHGTGKWKIILVDSEFAHLLANRSNVDLKDKWRNLGVNHGQGCEANAVTPTKGKATVSSAVTPKTKDKGLGANHGQGCEENSMMPKKGKETATSAVTPKTKSPVFISKGNSDDKPAQNPQDVKNAPDYNALIFEAVSSIKGGNGSEFGAILGFIQSKCEVPQCFKSLLSGRLRRLVLQGILEKVQKRYKIKGAASVTNTATPKQKDVRSVALPNSRLTIAAETLENAAKIAAHKIAEAENKSFVAAEAVKESERVSQMAEEADAVLMRLKEIFAQWEDEDNSSSKGSQEVIFML